MPANGSGENQKKQLRMWCPATSPTAWSVPSLCLPPHSELPHPSILAKAASSKWPLSSFVFWAAVFVFAWPPCLPFPSLWPLVTQQGSSSVFTLLGTAVCPLQPWLANAAEMKRASHIPLLCVQTSLGSKEMFPSKGLKLNISCSERAGVGAGERGHRHRHHKISPVKWNIFTHQPWVDLYNRKHT